MTDQTDTTIALPAAVPVADIVPGSTDLFLKLLVDPATFAARISEIRQATIQHNEALSTLTAAVAAANAKTVAKFADERREIAELKRAASASWAHSQQRESVVSERELRCLDRETLCGITAAKAPVMHAGLAQQRDPAELAEAYQRARRLAPGSGQPFMEGTTLEVQPDATEYPYPPPRETAAGKVIAAGANISNKSPSKHYRRRAKS
jgi:hypothetical protein